MLISQPAGSAALLTGASSQTPALTPDLPGDYVIELVVSDGLADSQPDQVTINAISATDFAQAQLQQACAFIAGLDPNQFDARGHQMSMQNSCALIAGGLQQGQVAQAKRKLQDLIERTDGVPLRGAVDPKGLGQPARRRLHRRSHRAGATLHPAHGCLERAAVAPIGAWPQGGASI